MTPYARERLRAPVRGRTHVITVTSVTLLCSHNPSNGNESNGNNRIPPARTRGRGTTRKDER
jgi:hypothetical protein